jgi:hypothetical protein
VNIELGLLFILLAGVFLLILSRILGAKDKHKLYIPQVGDCDEPHPCDVCENKTCDCK